MAIHAPRSVLLLVLSLAGALGCSESTSSTATEPTPDASGTAGGDGGVSTSDGSTLFDTSRVATLALEVEAADLETLRSDAAQPMGFEDFTYVPARLTYAGVVLENVGLRVKGNNSRVTAQGDAVPFKIDTNRYVDKQKLDGQTKLNLHNNVGQAAKMTEYLSYGAFREFGVPASRTGWVDLTLNGESLGVYTLVEQVGKTLLSRYYEDGSQDLYKPEPPAGFLTYSGDSFADYEGANYEADNDTTHATFLKLVTAIDSAPVADWEEVLDLDTVLDYLAGNVALGNWDTYTAMGHNYYLFEESPGRLVMLPWDLNLSQAATSAVCPADLLMNAAMGGGAAPGGEPPQGFGGAPPDFTGMLPGGAPPDPGQMAAGAQARSAPLQDKLLAEPTYAARYFERLRAFLDGPGSVAALSEHIDSARATLGQRITDADAQQLRDTVEQRVTAIEAALATTTACGAVGSTP